MSERKQYSNSRAIVAMVVVASILAVADALALSLWVFQVGGIN